MYLSLIVLSCLLQKQRLSVGLACASRTRAHNIVKTFFCSILLVSSARETSNIDTVSQALEDCAKLSAAALPGRSWRKELKELARRLLVTHVAARDKPGLSQAQRRQQQRRVGLDIRTQILRHSEREGRCLLLHRYQAVNRCAHQVVDASVCIKVHQGELASRHERLLMIGHP